MYIHENTKNCQAIRLISKKFKESEQKLKNAPLYKFESIVISVPLTEHQVHEKSKPQRLQRPIIPGNIPQHTAFICRQDARPES